LNESIAEYTITFASASNGHIGFSTASYSMYTEVVYVVLPREIEELSDMNLHENWSFSAYNLSIHQLIDDSREQEIVQCQLLLKENVDALWPSSVYFLYFFIVNGKQESNFVVRFLICVICCVEPLLVKEARTHNYARLEAKEPGTYICQCHIYYCGPYSSESHVNVIQQKLDVPLSAKSEAVANIDSLFLRWCHFSARKK